MGIIRNKNQRSSFQSTSGPKGTALSRLKPPIKDPRPGGGTRGYSLWLKSKEESAPTKSIHKINKLINAGPSVVNKPKPGDPNFVGPFIPAGWKPPVSAPDITSPGTSLTNSDLSATGFSMPSPPEIQAVMSGGVKDLTPKFKGIKDYTPVYKPGDPTQRAQTSANLEYDPQIAAVKALVQSQTAKANDNQSAISKLYSALTDKITGQAPEIKQNYATAESGVDSRTADVTKAIDDRYNATAARNANAFEALGIDQATPQVSQRGLQDRDFIASMLAAQGQGTKNVLDIQEHGATDLNRAQGNMAAGEGANRQADIRSQLADQLFSLGSQENSLGASKQSAIAKLIDQYKSEDFRNNLQVAGMHQNVADSNASILAQLAGMHQNVANTNASIRQQNAGRQMDAQQQNAALQMQAANLGLDTAKFRASMAQTPSVDRSKLNPTQALAYDADQLAPGKGSNYVSLLQSLIKSDKRFLDGRILDGYKKDYSGNPVPTYRKTTANGFAAVAARKAKAAGLNPSYTQQLAMQYWNDTH